MTKNIEIFLKNLNYHSFKKFLTLTRIIFTYFKIKKLEKPDNSPTKILVIRRGGIGDILFISAILKHIKSLNPSIRITFMTDSSNRNVVNSIPPVDHVAKISWRHIGDIAFNNKIIFLDNVIESDIDSENTNIYDLISEKYFGVQLENHEKIPCISVKNNLVEHFRDHIDHLTNIKSPKIGIQLIANSPIRTPEITIWSEIIHETAKSVPDSCFFVIIENKSTWVYNRLIEKIETLNKDLKGRIFNLAKHLNSTDDLFASIANFHLVITPDSSVIHIAAGLKIPAIGLYGPFPSSLRVTYYDNCIGIDAPYDCAPCFIHGHNPCPVAKKLNIINSPCFNKISPTIIADKAKALISLSYPIRKHEYHIFQSTTVNSTSETSKFREKIIHLFHQSTGSYINELNGVEIGSGGDPLVREAIVVDFNRPYTKCGSQPIHLKGNSKNLYWFKDNALDYLYSSHVFEDFSADENISVLKEWSRVVKNNGYLVLLLPNIYRYNNFCKSVNETPNEHHKILTFDTDYIKDILLNFSDLKLILSSNFWSDPNDTEYNFLIILQKV